MGAISLLPPACYVFDSSALIEIERRPGGKGLRDMPDFPGKWLVVPSKVAKQVNSKGAPQDTKEWLSGGKTSSFVNDTERRLYMSIMAREKALEDADIQGIVLASCRQGTYVVDEGPARKVAESLGTRCISGAEFLKELNPKLL
jgi:hypothetical protein